MTKIGYSAACEQYNPVKLLEFIQLAEKHGFSGAFISDHFQPWTPEQGESSFAWSLMGQLVRRLRLWTLDLA
ncbi:MAG: hypothetical protein ACOCXT_02855 [Candidatus Dojkabacteria bacterium]